MVVTPLTFDFRAELERIQAERAKSRSEGWHLSTIIKSINRKLDPKRFGREGGDALLFEVGFIWEDLVSPLLGPRLGWAKEQLEFEMDGIYLTLDGFNTKAWRPRECKLTKMSAKTPITSHKFWHWHVQAKAQCRVTETRMCELVPLYLNGTYEMAGGRFGDVICSPVIVEYTEMEIEENWEMVLREKNWLERSGSSPR